MNSAGVKSLTDLSVSVNPPTRHTTAETFPSMAVRLKPFQNSMFSPCENTSMHAMPILPLSVCKKRSSGVERPLSTDFMRVDPTKTAKIKIPS